MDNYKDIFYNLPEGILICNSSFKIININKTLENQLNIDKNQLIGKYCSEILTIDKNNCPICQSSADSNFVPEQYTHLAEITNNAGSNIPVRINHKVINNDYIASIITPLTDIAFLNQAHIDFVSTVSHELRTPLTSIKGFADTILSAGDKLGCDQQKRFVSIIKTQVDRLTRLVENLLTVSRLESQRDKSIYKAINFSQFIQPILSNLSPKSQEHIVEVNIHPNLPPIWGDSDKLEQVMTNLIDNAIKYSHKGTKVSVNASFDNNNHEFISIEIRDQGVGIPKEFLPKIFTKFSRIDNPLTRQVEGTGLGLYITKALVESMEGKISAESSDKGSTFTVKLPIATHEKHASEKFLERKV